MSLLRIKELEILATCPNWLIKASSKAAWAVLAFPLGDKRQPINYLVAQSITPVKWHHRSFPYQIIALSIAQHWFFTVVTDFFFNTFGRLPTCLLRTCQPLIRSICWILFNFFSVEKLICNSRQSRIFQYFWLQIQVFLFHFYPLLMHYYLCSSWGGNTPLQKNTLQ